MLTRSCLVTGIPKINRASQKPRKMIESPVVWIERRMVLARPPGSVTGWLEDFTDKSRIPEVPIASMVINPGKQTDSRGPALRGVVSLGVTNSVLGQAIQIGRLDLSTIATQIRIPHVIGHDENYIRPTR
jgi:hypothetical protein